MLVLNIFIFLGSCLALAFASKWLINSLSNFAACMKMKQFIVAFIIMAMAASLPNLIVGITTAIKGIPELSFGDIIGNNLIGLTLVLGLGAIIAKNGLEANSRIVQKSSLYMMFVAILPLLLIFDGKLSRGDGIILLVSFFAYIFWIFSKKERFSQSYENCAEDFRLKKFLIDVLIIIGSVLLLFIGAKGIVHSALYFSELFHLPLSIIGLLIVGLGNSMPEMFFTLRAAKKGENWMLIGDLMGGVIICATLVLGIVALIRPIEILDFSPFAIARVFLIISSLFFLISIRTGKKITRKEGIFFIFLYVFYLISEIFIKYF